MTQAQATRGWAPSAWVPILSQALGGILVGQITKRLGGISKGFAVVGGLTVTGLVQSLADGRMLSPELCVALTLVVFRCAIANMDQNKRCTHCQYSLRACLRLHPCAQHLAARALSVAAQEGYINKTQPFLFAYCHR